ncbi:SPOR domain-containing protein [Pseudoponticoccus marisrubri]|uniref:Sporulation protein n=1 Tax=Pseudoponticoccus marisrubri TaxID=1685382 RepID=A0A0W7WN19_9RHOB|nr:SPOR domain-containing protein [Pseudoponticoccus marisrubri]KUF11892.1 sporulation protein [Pseudoponticoccus marisrubri]
MADFTYEGGDMPPAPGKVASLTNWIGAAASLALVAGVGVWGYGVVSRDVSGVPVVQAMGGPMRVAPEDPGGQLAENTGLAVNTVAGSGATAPPPDRLVLAPQPSGLAEEDVAAGTLSPREDPPMQTSLAEQAEIMEVDPPFELAEDEDPIQALANQLAAGAAPLSELAPGEDKPVVTELAEPVEAEPEAAPRPLVDANGALNRSLRPRPRPAGLGTQVAAAGELPLPSTVSVGAREIDADTLDPGTRLVQIGAFDSPETARSEWDRLEGRFGEYLEGKDRVIQRANSGGRVFYRLRAHGFADLSDARRFCAAFVAQNVDCIPVVTR